MSSLFAKIHVKLIGKIKKEQNKIADRKYKSKKKREK